VNHIPQSHNTRFASLPTAIWEDPRITVEAKGVLGCLLSRLQRPQQVGQALDIVKDKPQRIFRELISAGCVTREQEPRHRYGAFGGIEYVVRDKTVASLPQPENPQPENPEPVNPQPANRAA
jgi:hypothetical protein